MEKEIKYEEAVRQLETIVKRWKTMNWISIH